MNIQKVEQNNVDRAAKLLKRVQEDISDNQKAQAKAVKRYKELQEEGQALAADLAKAKKYHAAMIAAQNS